ncbi:Branched-chain amino acid ABC transporter, permease protein [Acidilobus saccharovorans 345-15]|uniref:Branched-chain amino acid ABC transporter, permease protein n=1 Tax=Acidilobus saccharovorans (strain DSM 16705 / JCM 18335 / VKM B-2471 / 345-15) TaxID=666510 RepID=D9Q1L7_ACIS3|nr:branched-chain amino acid ABC transporter permease [Acidilobus saccharovorans]ADL19205.1 Branched-chain amino acid ABC transporter, permease protein [Acidilobus saccharovorans 345-15]
MNAGPLVGYALVVGLLEGLYFAFMALGLNLVFGVVRMVNIAHGDLIVMGGYLAFVLFSAFKLNSLGSMVAAFLLFFVVGIALYYVLVPRLQGSSDPEMFSFIAFFGISMFIEAIATLIFGEYPLSLPFSALLGGSVEFMGHGIPKAFIVMAGVSAAVLVLTYYYLEMTGLGRATRAMMQNPEQSAALGVNSKLVALFAFSYGIALAGAAGAFTPYVFGNIYAAAGTQITAIAFTIVIIGALGNPLSTVIGGLIFGVFYQVLEVFVPSLAYAIVFIALLAIIVAKPGGLLGGEQREV